jgi:hypothetical protein
MSPLPTKESTAEIARLAHGGLKLASKGIRRFRRLLSDRRNGRETVYIYSHPRTGSMSLTSAIRSTGRFAILHLHTIRPEHTRWSSRSWPVADDGVLRLGKIPSLSARLSMMMGRTRFVTPIRDPVAVNLSFFSYWGARYWVPELWSRLHELPDDEIGRVFLERYPHRSVLRWLELEFTPATGLPGSSLDFDTERGAAVLRSRRASALIVRADLPDERKRLELEGFLGIPVPKIGRENSSELRLADRPGLSMRLRRVVSRLPGYVDSLLDADFTGRFWSEAQREELRMRYRRFAEESGTSGES